MSNVFNYIQNNNFLKVFYFILLGVTIQATCMSITYRLVPRGEGWFSGFGQLMWYMLYTQWIGCIVQLIIVWCATKKIGKSFMICFVTILIFWGGYVIYVGIKDKSAHESYLKSQEMFYKEIEQKNRQNKADPIDKPLTIVDDRV